MRVQWRQGDVLFEEVPRRQGDLPVKGDGILFAGELTGHAHRVESPDGSARILVAAPGHLLLEVGLPGATILHEEHRPITLAEGVYRVWRQREYDPRGARAIQD